MKILRFLVLIRAVLEVTGECWPGWYSGSYEDCGEPDENLLSSEAEKTTVTSTEKITPKTVISANIIIEFENVLLLLMLLADTQNKFTFLDFTCFVKLHP